VVKAAEPVEEQFLRILPKLRSRSRFTRRGRKARFFKKHLWYATRPPHARWWSIDIGLLGLSAPLTYPL